METPLIEPACQKAGVSRSTYYRWRKEDSVFRKKADNVIGQGRLLVNDLAESKLMKLMKEDNLAAIKYWLDHNSKIYSEKKVYLSEIVLKTLVEVLNRGNNSDVSNRAIELFLSGEIDKSTFSSLISALKTRPKDIDASNQTLLKTEVAKLENLIDELSPHPKQ